MGLGRVLRSVVVVGGTAVLAAGVVVGTASSASAAPAGRLPALSGTTEVTTGPGIATTLLKAGVVPLPVAPASVRLGCAGGINVTYGFPIVNGNPDLSGPSGDINHTGGINFVSFRGRLEIGKFEIDLGAGKVYATKINFAPARIPVFALDLSRAQISQRGGTTTVANVGLTLESAAATALNSTFHLGLPTSGLKFGTAKVTLRG